MKRSRGDGFHRRPFSTELWPLHVQGWCSHAQTGMHLYMGARSKQKNHTGKPAVHKRERMREDSECSWKRAGLKQRHVKGKRLNVRGNPIKGQEDILCLGWGTGPSGGKWLQRAGTLDEPLEIIRWTTCHFIRATSHCVHSLTRVLHYQTSKTSSTTQFFLMSLSQSPTAADGPLLLFFIKKVKLNQFVLHKKPIPYTKLKFRTDRKLLAPTSASERQLSPPH